MVTVILFARECSKIKMLNANGFIKVNEKKMNINIEKSFMLIKKQSIKLKKKQFKVANKCSA